MSGQPVQRGLLIGVICVLACGWFWIQPALSQPPSLQQGAAAPLPVKWEYNTSAVDSFAIQAKLGELTNEGWEVFSITQLDTTILEQGPDGKPQLHVAKFQVTAKRPSK